jgi:hypothetical protein
MTAKVGCNRGSEILENGLLLPRCLLFRTSLSVNFHRDAVFWAVSAPFLQNVALSFTISFSARICDRNRFFSSIRSMVLYLHSVQVRKSGIYTDTNKRFATIIVIRCDGVTIRDDFHAIEIVAFSIEKLRNQILMKTAGIAGEILMLSLRLAINNDKEKVRQRTSLAESLLLSEVIHQRHSANASQSQKRLLTQTRNCHG